MSASLSPATSQDLARRRDALRAAEPRLYPRDIALRLNVTEAEIVALEEPVVARRLRPDWPALMGGLQTLGEVMALTRNADAVHEKIATYGSLLGNERVGLFLGVMDLRLFFGQWHHAWALNPPGARRSIQVFAADGTAVHKIHSTPSTDLAAWDRLVDSLAAPENTPLALLPSEPAAAAVADTEIDVTGFIAGWDALRDTHDFHGLLTRFGVTRTQGLRLAGPTRARPVAPTALRETLTAAAERALPIMVFVGNRGCIQIHTGPVMTLRETGPWFNVLDPTFNLHLRETAIDTAWVVSKPTDDGVVTSLELFDAAGEAIATLFGSRKPGKPEDPNWRALCAQQPDR